MDKLKELYQSYVDNGLISKKTSFEQFSSADQQQLQSLYDLGVSKKVISQKTDIDTFASAWSPQKKKELSEVSGSQFLGEPSASDTSRKQTEAERIGIDKTKLYQDAAMSIIRQGVESGDISEDVVVKNSNQPENIFLAVASARAAKDKTVSPEQERAAALLQNRQRSGEVTAPLESELKTLTQRNEQQKVERQNQQLQAEIQQKVKQAVINSIPEDKVGDKEYIQKIEDDLFLNQGLALDITGDRKINDQGVASDAISSLAAGLGSLNLGFRSVTDKIVGAFGIPVNTELPKTLLDESRRNAITTFEQDFYDSVKDGNFSNAARQAINLTAESAPLTVAAAALSYTGNPYAAYATVSALASVQTYGQVQNEEWFKELSPLAQLGYISSTGAAEGVGEMAGGRVLNRAIRGLANSATKEASQKALKEYITGMIRAGAINVSEESIGEGITGGSQYVIDALAKGEAVTANGFLDAFKRSAASGAAMAGVISTPTSAASTASYLANKIGSNYQVRKIDNAIKSAKESLLSTENPEDHSVIVSNIVELQKIRNNFVNTDVKFYENMSDEDRNRIFVLNAQVEELSNKNKVTTSEEAKNIIKQDVASKIEEIKQIESRYDRQEEVGVPSPVVEGEAVIEAQPVEGAGQEAPEAGRVLQVPVEQEPVVIGDLVNKRVTYSDPVSGTLVEGDLFQEGQRLIVESDQGQQFDLGNADELSNETLAGSTLIQPATESVIPQQDGSFVYNLKGDQKIPYQTRLFNREEGLRSIKRNKDGDISRVTLQSEDGTQTFNLSGQQAEDAAYYIMRDFVQRAENAESIEQLIQINNEARTEIEQATIAPEVAVPTQEAAAEVTEAVAVEPVVEGTIEEVEQDEPQAKNKNNLTEAVASNAIAQAERLSKRLGLGVKIVTHNSRKAFDEAMNQLSKNRASDAAREGGRILFDRNEIHINLEDMTLSDPFHEVFHAAFANRFAKGSQTQRTKAALEFKNGILKVLRSGSAQDKQLADEVEQFVNDGNYNPSEKAEEFMAQTAGIIATSAQRISKSTMDKLIQWLNNFISKIAPSMKVTTRGEFIDFMNSFSGALFADTDSSVQTTESTVNLTSTNDLLDSSSRGDFTISYFEDTDQYKKFVDDGLVVNNFNLDQIAGQPVATHQPDNFMVGDVKLGDKVVVEGDGGVYFVLKFGEVWASGKPSSASGIAKAINWSRENSTDGKGRMLLARGTTPKLISSTKGVKGGMQILEEMVERNLIPRKDFRASLIRVGKKYGIDFSGNDSMTSIKKDIEQKFMKPSDSTFAKRGSFFEDLISDISSTSAASKENIGGIRKFLGSKKRISFSKEGITSAIAELMTERMLIDLPSSHAYAVIEVDNDVKVEKSKKHDSYPYSIVQVNGKRPTLYLLKDRLKAVPSLLTKDGDRATNAKVGFAQMGYGRAIVDPALLTSSAAQTSEINKAYDDLLESSSKKQVQLGMQQAEINYEIDTQLAESSSWQQRERTPMEKFNDLIRIKIQDKLYGVIKLQEDIEYSTGKPVGLDQDFRNAETLMHGKAANDLNESMERAEKVAENVKKSGTTLEAFDDLLYALHAQERNRMQRIKNTDIPTSIKDLRDKNNLKPMQVAEMAGIDIETYRELESGTAEKGITSEELNKILSVYGMSPSQFYTQYTKNNAGSGMTDIEAQTILSTYGLDPVKPEVKDLKPALRDAVNGVYEIIADSRERMLKYGLETADTIVSFESLYKNYVPLQGFEGEDLASEIIDGGRSIEVRWRPKRALGRKSKADSPFLTAIAQNQSTIVRARKNEVAQKLYRLAETNPNDQIWKVIDPAVNKEYKKDPTVNGIKYVAKTISDYLTKPENFSVRINGEYKFIQFTDPRMAEMLRGANVVKADFITKYLGQFNRIMSAYITTYNPEFVVGNFFRDIQVAVINAVAEQEIDGGLLKGKNITDKIIKSTAPSIFAIVDVEFNRNVNSEFTKYYKEFIEDGAKTEWFYSKSVDELRKDVDKLIGDKKDTRLGSTKVKAAEDFAKNFMERVNTSVENGVRLASYIEARKAGVSRDKAAELAKNLTVNFNKSGEFGTVANSAYLFFNASVQGTSRLIRTLKPQFKKNDDGTRSLQITRAQKIAASMFVLGGIMSLLNEAISDDDEDGKSFYSKIPDFEKERNFIIMTGEDYEKFPLPYGLNVFYVSGNAMADAGQGLKSVGETATNILQAAIGSFSPINFPSSEDFSSWIFKFITPTIGQIPLALALNENYFGRTIYNENFPTDPTPKPESELGRKGATELSTWIAKELNKITGGSEFRSGYDINPDKIDFVLETLSGGSGRFALRTTSAVSNLMTGNWDQMEANEIPFARMFYGQPRKFVDLQSYFDKRIEVNQYMEEVKADKITGAEKSRIREAYNISKAVDKSLRGLRESEKKAEKIEDPDKRDIRLREIELKRYAQIAKFQKAYEQYKIDEL
jgi:transcriptional regulator with XRE-family HTH domain